MCKGNSLGHHESCAYYRHNTQYCRTQRKSESTRSPRNSYRRDQNLTLLKLRGRTRRNYRRNLTQLHPIRRRNFHQSKQDPDVEETRARSRHKKVLRMLVWNIPRQTAYRRNVISAATKKWPTQKTTAGRGVWWLRIILTDSTNIETDGCKMRLFWLSWFIRGIKVYFYVFFARLPQPHCRKGQLPLRSLRDLRSCQVIAPVRPWQDRNISGPKGPRDTRGKLGISEARCMLCNFSTFLVLLFFLNWWSTNLILQTVFLQTGRFFYKLVVKIVPWSSL